MSIPLRRSLATAALLLAAMLPTGSRAQSTAPEPARTAVAPRAAPALPRLVAFDVDSATRVWLDRLSTAQKQRSDAYFEGGYWLLLWNFLWTSTVMLLLLQTGWSARIRNTVRRVTRFRWIHTFLYFAAFVVAVALLQLPLSIYRDYVREHQYGLSNLTFAGWLGEMGKSLLVSIILGGLFVALAYAVVRRVPRRWWLWGAALAIAFLTFAIAIGPVAILPLFNNPKRLADERVVTPILRMARANGIDATDVWEVDASKQSKRISANVSGLFGTERITLNDNLLARAQLPEIEAVMGHEMGHYVLNHIPKMILEMGIVIVVGFALVAWGFERLRARWGIEGIGDLAGLPLIVLLFTVYFFVLTPVTNTMIRTQEYEADIFGLNAARQPDGFAQAALDLSEYRKMEPGRLEEAIFYDHPSGRTRIHAAMRWKAANELRAAPASP